MKFSQFIEGNSLSFSSPINITKEEWERITDAELERTEEVTFRTPSGKEVLFRKVKYGEWKEVTNGRGGHECSLCGNYAPSYQSGTENLSDFCPNCGADMREKGEAGR